MQETCGYPGFFYNNMEKRIYPDDALIMAPLSGYTDWAYRRSMRLCGCKYAFTEMIDISSLTYRHPRSLAMLERREDEEFLGVQIVGCDPEHLKRAMEVVNTGNFDVADFNMGCPVPKVTKKGAGAALGRDIERATDLFRIFATHSAFPVTAKFRILSEENPTPTVELAQALVAAGARAVTIHGRLMGKFYAGPVFADMIAAVRAALPPEIAVVANGGVMSRDSAETLRRESGCGPLMLARGAMGNPWLFREIIDQDRYIPPTTRELLDMMTLHVEGMVLLYGETVALRLARKIVLDYLRGRGFPGVFRGEASFLSTLEQYYAFAGRAEALQSEGYWRNLELHPHCERALRRA